MLLVLLLGVGVSLYVWFRFRHQGQLSDGFVAMQLLVDVVLLFCLVWFNGRSTNPFIYYLLVIVAVSASILPGLLLWAFSIGSIAIYSFLMYFDLNEHLLHMPHDFQLHLLGMWLNFVGSALLISFFISRLTTALRDRERLLAAAREETLKNEQLIGIGTIAASTVHSLGTPLSTIALSIGELRAQNSDEETEQYLSLMQSQIERCKTTMRKLSLLANNDSQQQETFTLALLVADMREYFLLVNANPQPQFIVQSELHELRIPGNLLLKHALTNLIDNAVQAAKTLVTVNIIAEGESIRFIIEDDGDGIANELVDKLGKPVPSSKAEGLGIGIFLANSTIEKLAGKVRFYNAELATGRMFTQVIVDIPLSHSKSANNITDMQNA